MSFSLNGMGTLTDTVATGAWAPLLATDFETLTANAIVEGDRFAALAIKNTHETDSLYILLRDDGEAETAVGDAIEIEPLGALTLDCSDANGGAPPIAISVQGSGAETSYKIIATLARKF